MRDEKEERKKQAWSNKQTNKAKQHSTPKAVTFPRKNELPQVGLEPTTLYTLDRALYQLSYRGSSAGWAQISHLIVHLMNRLTCTTLKAHLQTLYKIQLQANLLQTVSRLSGRETGETSACISCSPVDVGLKFTFLQKIYVSVSEHPHACQIPYHCIHAIVTT